MNRRDPRIAARPTTARELGRPGRTGPALRHGSALVVALALGLAGTPVRAAPASDGPVQGPTLPSVEDEPDASAPLPDVEGTQSESESESESESDSGSDTRSESGAQSPPVSAEPPPPTLQAPEQIRVAVGLSSELDGNKQERALLDQLERAVMASSSPRAEVRRLRVGAAAPKEICREGRDDLVITIGTMPNEPDPMLFTWDCSIDQELGLRRSAAADDPALLGVLWSEHGDRVSNGARERRRARVSPKVRTGLIAGAAVAVIGVAVGLLIFGAVQRDRVVLVVSP